MWQSPSLQQLLFLEAILEEGNLVRTASRLHTTYSTISRGLGALSNGLGTEFFDRTPSGLKANDVGIVYGSEIRRSWNMKEGPSIWRSITRRNIVCLSVSGTLHTSVVSQFHYSRTSPCREQQRHQLF